MSLMGAVCRGLEAGREEIVTAVRLLTEEYGWNIDSPVCMDCSGRSTHCTRIPFARGKED